MTINLDSILDFFEKKLVSSGRQYQWDNSGKQIYLGDTQVKRVGFALDPSQNVINHSIKEGCELLITHHPLFFSQIKSIDTKDINGQKSISAIQNGLNIVSYHTSFDLADFSLNDYLAGLLDATVLDNFVNEGADTFYKYVVFVPVDHKDVILDAMDRAGAGHIGNYSKASFRVKGTGTFMPSEETSPFIGESGVLEEVEEYRIETIVPQKKLKCLIRTVADAHPYEEVAYDVYPVELSEPYGLGRVCQLSEQMTLDVFLRFVGEKLGIQHIQHNAENLSMLVENFAVVTGSGASLWKKCLKKGIKVLLTGDMKHHDALDAAENGIVVIDAGHYATERVFMKYLSEFIASELKVETILIDEKNSIYTWRL